MNNNQSFKNIYTNEMEKKYLKFLKNKLNNNKIIENQYNILKESFNAKINNINFRREPENILEKYLENGKNQNNENYLSRLQILLNNYITYDDVNNIILYIVDNKKIDYVKVMSIINNLKRIEYNLECSIDEFIISDLFKKMNKPEFAGLKKKDLNSLIIGYNNNYNVFKKYKKYVTFKKMNFFDINSQNYLLNKNNELKYNYVIIYFSLSKIKNIENFIKNIYMKMENNSVLIILDNDITTLEDSYTIFLNNNINSNIEEKINNNLNFNPLNLLETEFILKKYDLYHIISYPLLNYFKQKPQYINQYMSFYLKR